ncbi:hypothetical protein, partial [Pseudomonas viridiflava]|uniref:hypothetical protein n=1 Tax=Pseudomonas viridiflava TaxID=33069 RepID=UPI0019D24187
PAQNTSQLSQRLVAKVFQIRRRRNGCNHQIAVVSRVTSMADTPVPGLKDVPLGRMSILWFFICT